jgi:hypothetical protein
MTAALILRNDAWADYLPSGACYVPVYHAGRVTRHEWVTPDDIAADLAPWSGLRLPGDDTVAIIDTDPDWLCQGALTAAARRVMGRRA